MNSCQGEIVWQTHQFCPFHEVVRYFWFGSSFLFCRKFRFWNSPHFQHSPLCLSLLILLKHNHLKVKGAHFDFWCMILGNRLSESLLMCGWQSFDTLSAYGYFWTIKTEADIGAPWHSSAVRLLPKVLVGRHGTFPLSSIIRPIKGFQIIVVFGWDLFCKGCTILSVVR